MGANGTGGGGDQGSSGAPPTTTAQQDREIQKLKAEFEKIHQQGQRKQPRRGPIKGGNGGPPERPQNRT